MGNASFNQDWYGMQAKVLAQSDDQMCIRDRYWSLPMGDIPRE